jgi:hypothetical protein
MTRLRHFVLALATTSVLAGGVFGANACAPMPTPTPAAAKTQPVTPAAKVIAKYGDWEVRSLNGQRYVSQRFDDGASVMMARINGDYVVMFINPVWKLTEGQEFPVKATIDGKGFEGTATALDGTSVAIRVNANFMKAMYRGDQAVITVVRDKWTLGLSDAAKALDAAGAFETVSR